MEKNQKVKYNYVGSMNTPSSNKKIIEEILDSNIRSTELGDKKVCQCTWGTHGIGKTAIPKQIAEERGWGFRSITPSEFEEMGDFLGMPGTGLYVNKDGEEKVVDSRVVEQYTSKGWSKSEKPPVSIYSPPQWVPNPDLGDPEEGIFLIDDVNRCDPRILNGIMGLLQFGEVISWKLPKGWHIVLTANPTGGTYQVEEMDDAQMTRMVHTSMIFDAKDWAKWANINHVDSRVINFILKNKECITSGLLTTPRSICNFSRTIRHIPDLKERLGYVLKMAEGCLDKTTAAQFTTFINDGLSSLISPSKILSTTNFKKEVEENVIKEFCKGGVKRVDVLSILSTRLTFHVLDTLKCDLDETQLKNFKSFIKCTDIPNDIRLTIARDVISTGNTKFKKSILRDKEIAKLIIQRM